MLKDKPAEQLASNFRHAGVKINPDYLNHIAQDLYEAGYTLTAEDLRKAASEIERLRFEVATLKSELNMEKNK
jgi:hypothetical protein